MSVPKSERGESAIQFVATARTLWIHTVRKCASFPKRYTFYVGQPIAQQANRVYQWVVKADAIYPRNAHEYQIRRDCLIKANAELRSLVANIEAAAEMFPIDADAIRYWTQLVWDEARLVKGALKSDSGRFGRLQ